MKWSEDRRVPRVLCAVHMKWMKEHYRNVHTSLDETTELLQICLYYDTCKSLFTTQVTKGI